MEQVIAVYGDDVDFYTVLGVDRTADSDAIKRGYFKLARLCHPDRCHEEDKDASTLRFQALGTVYNTLSDESQRRYYDTTGELAQNASGDGRSATEWFDYWRAIYRRIETEDIDAFFKEYRYSDEEAKDVKFHYIDCDGDMDMLIERVMCCDEDDVDRFAAIIHNGIDAGELVPLCAFTREYGSNSNSKENAPDDGKSKGSKSKGKTKRRNKYAHEAEEAEELAKEIFKKRGGHGGSVADINSQESLRALIHRNHEESHANMLAALEAKYSSSSSTGKGNRSKKMSSITTGRISKKKTKEPSEADFQKARARLENTAAAAGKKKAKKA